MPRGASPDGRRSVDHEGQSSEKNALRTVGKELPDVDTEQEFQANWKITKAEEERLLKQFHEELVSKGLFRPDHDKYYIRRFLRARQHDIGKATQFYTDHIKWRRENDVDDILTNFDFHERDMFLTLYPQGYHKTDRMGRPVYIQHLGAINIKKLTDLTTEDRMLRFHIQEYERCTKYIMGACSRVAGHHVDQTFAIIDVTGVGAGHLTGQVKQLLGKITAIDQANYPEMMGKTLILNAPGLFKLVWAIVKRFLDARTLSKIELLGGKGAYEKVLLKYIPEENLPTYLGGKSEATLLDDAGPWKDQKMIDEINADYRAALSHDLEADGSSRAVEAEPSPSGRQDSQASAPGQSPPRRSISRVSSRSKAQYQVPTQHNLKLLPNASDSRFSDAVELQNRSHSYASDAEDGYYSPRSDSNFSSFTERTSAGLDEEQPLHPRLTAADAKTGNVNEKHMSLAMRIRRLENAIPLLKDKLPPALSSEKFTNGNFTSTGGNDTLGRVEALEDAVEILFTIQEENLVEARPRAEFTEEVDKSGARDERSTCGCCSIM